MATHSSILAWRIPGTGEPGGAAICGVAQSQTRLKWLSSSRMVLVFTILEKIREGPVLRSFAAFYGSDKES